MIASFDSRIMLRGREGGRREGSGRKFRLQVDAAAAPLPLFFRLVVIRREGREKNEEGT
jgi:hypothetical protein